MKLRSAPTHEVFPEDVLRDIREAAWVIGTDEVGYGAWAGPLVVAAVLVPKGWIPPAGLTDSKKVKKEEAREQLFDVLLADPSVQHLVHTTPPEKLDQLGVGVALVQAHQSLHASFRMVQPSALCIADGNLALGAGILSEPRADGYVSAVSAASIIAKVTRDRVMREADNLYQGYGFASHKGYGGNEEHAHMKALRKLGPCPIHRRSYQPIAGLIQDNSLDEPLFAWEVPAQED